MRVSSEKQVYWKRHGQQFPVALGAALPVHERLAQPSSADGAPFPFSFTPNQISLFHGRFRTRAPVSKTGVGLSVHRGFESPLSAAAALLP
jgi:hypothetical protein